MRQRRVTGIEERLAPYADLILTSEEGANQRDGSCGSPRLDPLEPSLWLTRDTSPRFSRWYQRLSPRYDLPEGFQRVYAEFGCGRGLFINTLAAEDPEGLYIGIEGCKTIVIRALEKTKAASLSNLRYIDSFVNDAGGAFGEGSLSGIFLNFSDPWPKDRHADRRLTAPFKAEKYFQILKNGGFISLKTDGKAFFDYSLETITEAGFRIAGSHCEIAKESPDIVIAERAYKTATEYELKFRSEGKQVYHFTALKI